MRIPLVTKLTEGCNFELGICKVKGLLLSLFIPWQSQQRNFSFLETKEILVSSS
jgi:hypothetical protein